MVLGVPMALEALHWVQPVMHHLQLVCQRPLGQGHCRSLLAHSRRCLVLQDPGLGLERRLVPLVPLV